MARQVQDRPLLAMEGETKALTTTVAFIAIKPGWDAVKLYCASQWRLALCPSLEHVLYYNGTTYTEYKTNATDRDSGTHVPLDAMAATDILYLGTSKPVRGFYFDIGSNANAIAATLDMEYCSTTLDAANAIAFTDVAGDSDGTASGGATLAVDGLYSFTLPAVKHSLLGTWGNRLYSDCYWIRFSPSTALSATVDINEIIPVYENTNYGYMEAGVVERIPLSGASVGGLAVLATAGTPTLDLTWEKY